MSAFVNECHLYWPARALTRITHAVQEASARHLPLLAVADTSQLHVLKLVVGVTHGGLRSVSGCNDQRVTLLLICCRLLYPDNHSLATSAIINPPGPRRPHLNCGVASATGGAAAERGTIELLGVATRRDGSGATGGGEGVRRRAEPHPVSNVNSEQPERQLQKRR